MTISWEPGIAECGIGVLGNSERRIGDREIGASKVDELELDELEELWAEEESRI